VHIRVSDRATTIDPLIQGQATARDEPAISAGYTKWIFAILTLRTLPLSCPSATLRVLLSASSRSGCIAVLPGHSTDLQAPRLRTSTLKDLPHENARKLLQKTGRPLHSYINRQIVHLSRKGQLKFSVAVSLPFIATLEFSYLLEFDR
jgi:hypothetical protein